ncbi:ABC transporter permease [Methyloligella sp. 2.7D]|uniref:ABC transporter permease n=1 Tax=unclassified Methyloligella TaxID=2625955 RepID=UPI00157D69C5|nr:ABC transporter permease [Methyloligella sp. GL2]QKP78094.1 ABC transporter permease [Methyloligella sp. GL2]
MRAFGNKALVTILGLAVLFFLYAPLFTMAVFSFNDSNYTGLPFNGFTLEWYAKVFANEQIIRSFGASVFVAVGVVILSVTFGLPAAIALDRYDFPGKAWFRRIVMLPIVLPGVITGVALLSFYVAIGLNLSLYTIMLGQGTALICITATEVFARLQQLGRSTSEAAVNLGANELEVFWKVTLPNIKSALLGAMLIAFSISFDEIAVTYLLTGRENTLPMTLWSMLRREATPEVNAIATLVVVLSVVLIVLGFAISRSRNALADTGEAAL